MAMNLEEQKALAALEARVRTILPDEYQDCYEDMQPVAMGSADLKYGKDGKVLWDEIWESFCDLAMAGGPPHKGKLLGPGSQLEISAGPDKYRGVVDEICRGVLLVTGLKGKASSEAGWIAVDCESAGMAGWLVRAIVMENVSVQWRGKAIYLPAGPGYRVEKEVKNVITVMAKTCHHWQGHMWLSQQREISNLFAVMEAESPLIEPMVADPDSPEEGRDKLRRKIADAIEQGTGLRASHHQCNGWLGVECPDVRSAIWMMRALVVSNCLARREETVLFVPVNTKSDPEGERVARAVVRIHRFAVARGIL